jgi:riboflavin-specific deaminase-like protein
MLRVFPPPGGALPLADTYADPRWPEPSPARPYVVLNMVSTVDGKVAVGGGAAGIGSDADRRLMRQLRARADAVMSGAGTLRAEDYSSKVPARYRAERLARGQAEQPMAVIVSGSGQLPADRSLFWGEGFRRLLLTSERGAGALPPEQASRLQLVLAGEEVVDLGAGLRLLRMDYGVRWLVCEGGPHLNHSLLSAGLVDELFLTLAPKLVASTGPTVVEGSPFAAGVPAALSLVTVHAVESELFLRYRVQNRVLSAEC